MFNITYPSFSTRVKVENWTKDCRLKIKGDKKLGFKKGGKASDRKGDNERGVFKLDG